MTSARRLKKRELRERLRCYDTVLYRAKEFERIAIAKADALQRRVDELEKDLAETGEALREETDWRMRLEVKLGLRKPWHSRVDRGQGDCDE